MSRENMEKYRNQIPYSNMKWGMPEYTNWMDESMSWKKTCYVGDWSITLSERWFHGNLEEICRFFSEISVNSFEKFAIGQSKHLIFCNKDGMVIHDGVISRLGEQDFMVFGRNGFYANYYLEKNRERFPGISTEAEEWFNLQVSGPNAIKLLEKAFIEDAGLRNAKYMYSVKAKLPGLDIWALRQGMAGEPGFELHGPLKMREEVIDYLMDIGKEFGVRRLGGRTVYINHLEACFPTVIVDYMPALFSDDMQEYLKVFKASMPASATTLNIAGSYEGEEIRDYYRSPYELGWGARVSFNHDFIGREALEKEAANRKRIVRTLVWNSEDVIDVYASLFQQGEHYDFIELPITQRRVSHYDKVLKNNKLVGVTSSCGYSYYYRQMICLAVMDLEEAEIGNEVTVIWGAPGNPQKEIRAVVAPAPYKPDNSKGDLNRLF